MKVFQVIAVITILCLQVTFALQTKTTNESNEKLNSGMLEKLMSEANCGIDIPSDCGCKIIKAYWAPPHKPKQRPYKRRWPQPIKIKTKKGPAPPKATCDGPEGALFYYKLKALFPKPKKHKHGKHGKGGKCGKGKKCGKGGKDGKGGKALSPSKWSGGSLRQKLSRTVVKTKVTSKVSATGTLGPFGQKIIQAVEGFLRRYHLDIHPKRKSISSRQAHHLKAIAKAGAQISGKADKKKKKHKKLTYEQKERLKALRIKKTLLRKQRSIDFHKLRKMLQDNYKYPYKGDKCVAIGQFIKRATSYAL